MTGAPVSRSALRQQATQVADTIWEIPPTAKAGMRVSARIYASAELFAQLDDGVFEQVTNVGTPGIVGHAYAGLAEEAGAAYKDIGEVIGTVERAGLSRAVARFTPIGNVKG